MKNKPDIYKTIGSNIFLYRKTLGWSASKLAKQTGFSVSFISNIEKGTRKPTLLTLEKIASEMGIGLSAFFKPKENSGYDPEDSKLIFEILRAVSGKTPEDKKKILEIIKVL